MVLWMVSTLGDTGSTGLCPPGFYPEALMLPRGSAMLPLGREKPAGGVSQRKRETKNSSPGEPAQSPFSLSFALACSTSWSGEAQKGPFPARGSFIQTARPPFLSLWHLGTKRAEELRGCWSAGHSGSEQ